MDSDIAHKQVEKWQIMRAEEAGGLNLLAD